METNNKKPDCYVINLDRKKNDYEKFKQIWNNYFNIIRVSAVDSEKCNLNGRECCKKSHLDLMKKFILENDDDNDDDNFIIIAEDDVYQTEVFDNYWEKILYFIKNNNDYDLIHLDILLNLDKEDSEILEYNDIFYTYSKGRNTGLIIYNKRFLKEFVNSKNFDRYYKNLNLPLDSTLLFDNKLIKLTCKELIVRQFTDKISEITKDRRYVKHYDKWYDETNEYLLSNSIKK